MFGSRALLLALSFAAALPFVTFAVGCDKTSSGTGAGPDKSATASASASAPAASSVASASAAPADSASAGSVAEPTPSASTSGTAISWASKSDGGKPASSAAASASGGGSGAGECGTKPLPDCPLQAWMKANANPPVMTSNLPALQTALEKIVAFAPPGYTNWASIAKDGANAAKSGDLAAAKASCRTCHDQYKQKYKTEMRARKI